MTSRFFSDKKVNTGRQSELDLLKALCVLGMIFNHISLDLGSGVASAAIDDYMTGYYSDTPFYGVSKN